MRGLRLVLSWIALPFFLLGALFFWIAELIGGDGYEWM